MKKVILTNKVFSRPNLLSDYKKEMRRLRQNAHDTSSLGIERFQLRSVLRYLIISIVDFGFDYQYGNTYYSLDKQRELFISLIEELTVENSKSELNKILTDFLIRYKYIKLEETFYIGDLLKFTYTDGAIRYYLVGGANNLIRFDDVEGTKGWPGPRIKVPITEQYLTSTYYGLLSVLSVDK